jgi:type IV pilus assembly protein PilB
MSNLDYSLRALEELRQRQRITLDAFEEAKEAADINPDNPDPLYQARRMGAIDARAASEALAIVTGQEAIVLEDDFTIDNAFLDGQNEVSFSPTAMQEFRFVPIDVVDGALRIATDDPDAQQNFDRISFMVGNRPLKICVIDPFTLDQIVRRYAPTQEVANTFALGADFDQLESQIERDTDLEDLHQELDGNSAEGPIPRIAQGIIESAVASGASDIHLEPGGKGLRVRFRIDGALQQFRVFDGRIAGPLINRFKMMSKLDPGVRNRPQDGRMRVSTNGNRVVDFRTATIPTRMEIEKVTLRILDQSAADIDLQKLGITGATLEALEDAIAAPHGMVLVTGPTGSGKTTTLYGLLRRLNRVEYNVMTIEDPIEYDLPGITQTPVNEKAGMSFEAAVRAFLRADPDIIMLGEIRDGITANTALRAALTGHLVLSTIHTNDAPEAITRLRNLGVEAANLAGAIRVVIAQRLLRRLCQRCRRPSAPTPDQVRAMGGRLNVAMEARLRTGTFYSAAGCRECNRTGYRGRIGVYEILRATDTIRDHIATEKTTMDIRRTAISEGMQPLREQAIRLAEQGITSLGEVIQHTVGS